MHKNSPKQIIFTAMFHMVSALNSIRWLLVIEDLVPTYNLRIGRPQLYKSYGWTSFSAPSVMHEVHIFTLKEVYVWLMQ